MSIGYADGKVLTIYRRCFVNGEPLIRNEEQLEAVVQEEIGKLLNTAENIARNIYAQSDHRSGELEFVNTYMAGFTSGLKISGLK